MPKFLGMGTVFALTPCTEEKARAFSTGYGTSSPVDSYLAKPALMAPDRRDPGQCDGDWIDDDDDDEDEEHEWA